MKKIIIICIVGILLSTAFGAAAQTIYQENNTESQSRAFTHSVLAEFGTTSTCGYCPYAHMALKRIYNAGWWPFYFVTYPTNKNTHAATRMSEYNLYGVPDTFFDGGYRICYGAYTSETQMMSWYNTTINQCGPRTVPDIITTLNVDWLGDATMDIQVSVQNNDPTLYNGKIRVYVTEVESSLGWKDAQNHLYTYPFLDYAFNEAISIDASSTWSDSITWDGNNYNDGHGNTFGNIQYGNIMVIAAVYNATGHSAFSDPPDNLHPFTAYYVDDSTGFFVGDNNPNPPSNPDPNDGATGVDIHKTLSWTGGGQGTITYDVYFGSVNPPPKVSSNQSATTYNPGTLNYDTTYYWKIIAWNQDHNFTEGPIWSFTTTTSPNNPPDDPTMTGPAKGKPDTTYVFTIVGTDPDGDDISAYINWGDGTTTDWTTFHSSGESFTATHSWTTKGDFTIQVKIKDEAGAESNWVSLQITMPKSFEITNPFVQWFFQHFPNAFPLLRQFLGV